jgi:hypothetical protein
MAQLVPRTLSRIAWLAFVGLAAGCGEPVNEVSGTVRLDGQPLADASVQFHPADDLYLGLYYGRTDADGRFVLASRAGNSVKPGKYVVLISKPVKKDGSAPSPEDDPMEMARPGTLHNALPPVYESKATSPFTAEVHPGKNDLPLFSLRSKP